jgi:hypothetical protein
VTILLDEQVHVGGVGLAALPGGDHPRPSRTGRDTSTTCPPSVGRRAATRPPMPAQPSIQGDGDREQAGRQPRWRPRHFERDERVSDQPIDRTGLSIPHPPPPGNQRLVDVLGDEDEQGVEVHPGQ